MIVTATTAVIILFWITGILPAYIARTSSEKYVEAKYKSREFKFLEVYWDDNWERYFVSFKDIDGNVVNLKMSEYIPSSVIYDPLNPPG